MRMFTCYVLFRMFTHRVPEGAQGRVRQQWLLTGFLAIQFLPNRLLMSSFPSISMHYSACISTYRYGMGLHHRRSTGGSTAVPVAGSTDLLFLATTTIALAGWDGGL